MDSKIKQKLNKILKKQEVVLAYLFGSFAYGKTSPLSDFDLAILFSKKVSLKKYFNYELKIAGKIGEVLKIEQVDIVNLATSRSPFLNYNAVIAGKNIFCEDEKLKFNLETKIMKEYEDTKYLRTVQNKIMRQQIKQGIFGKPPFSIYTIK